MSALLIIFKNVLSQLSILQLCKYNYFGCDYFVGWLKMRAKSTTITIHDYRQFHDRMELRVKNKWKTSKQLSLVPHKIKWALEWHMVSLQSDLRCLRCTDKHSKINQTLLVTSEWRYFHPFLMGTQLIGTGRHPYRSKSPRR